MYRKILNTLITLFIIVIIANSAYTQEPYFSQYYN